MCGKRLSCYGAAALLDSKNSLVQPALLPATGRMTFGPDLATGVSHLERLAPAVLKVA